MNSQAMTVMAVSPDRAVLRQLHRLLSTFGYTALVQKELSWKLNGLHHVSPHFLIVDYRTLDDNLRPLIGIREQHPAPYPYVFLLYDETSGIDIIQAMEADVDDFLTIPINRAEVLARLKAGASYLESRRKGDDLLQTDADTGLMTGAAFGRLLRRHADRSDAPGSCVLMELDHFGQLSATIGWPAAKRALHTVADSMRELCRSSYFPARWQGYRFSALLPNTPLEQARKWAEKLRERVADCHTVLEIERLRLTASVGVGSWCPGADAPADLLRRTETALKLAIESGRNNIMSTSEIERESDEWADGKHDPFADAKAGDVMTPAAVLLESTETVGVAAAKLNRSKLDVVPVVDHRRRLMGVVRGEDIAAHADSQVGSRPVHTVMSDAVARVQEETPLDNLIKHLTDARLNLAVVVHGDVPKGIITQSDLAVLMRPVLHEYPALQRGLHEGAGEASESIRREAPSWDSGMPSVHGTKLGENGRVDDRSANA